MSVWIKRSLLLFTAFLVIAGGAYYWFIVESKVPSDAAYAFDIDEVRRLVATVPGDKPVSIEVERVGNFRFPATAVVAGDGWSMRDLPVFSYRLVYPDHSIVIDTALNAELGGDNLSSFDQDAFG